MHERMRLYRKSGWFIMSSLPNDCKLLSAITVTS